MQRKFNVIVKAGADKFLKYRNVTNLLSLYKYLDLNFPDWRYVQIFEHKNYIASGTKKNRLVTRDL